MTTAREQGSSRRADDGNVRENTNGLTMRLLLPLSPKSASIKTSRFGGPTMGRPEKDSHGGRLSDLGISWNMSSRCQHKKLHDATFCQSPSARRASGTEHAPIPVRVYKVIFAHPIRVRPGRRAPELNPGEVITHLQRYGLIGRWFGEGT